MSNKVTFQIENEDGHLVTWKNVAIPIKYGKLLDEQLDYATVDLVRVKKKEFKLLSKAIITITDKDGNKEELCYFLANDNSFETPVGSGAYNHTLTLIELTKYLECFPMESLCFTNPSGNKLVENVPNYKYYVNSEYKEQITTPAFEGFNSLKTPIIANKTYTLPNIDFSLVDLGAKNINTTVSKITVLNNNDANPYYTTTFAKADSNGVKWRPVNPTFTIKEGINVITYEYRFSSDTTQTIKEVFTVAAVASYLPFSPWTVERVIQRVLDLVEPLREGETTRFTFTAPEGKESVFNQVAPEFTFTRMTLREALQAIGGYIHAEPRLTKNNEIVFDFYGEDELATYNIDKPLNEYKYKTYQGAHGIDQACNTLDSYIDNLVNRINLDSGTVANPYGGGAQTLRSEANYVRIEENDGTASFVTNFPIDSIKKFEYNNGGTWCDLTPYIYEKNIYDNLSSFDENYPYSKATALEFSYGEKGIRGFWFKNPSAIDQSFKNYSITNIINRVTGQKKDSYNYQTLEFRLTYIPIYSTRVRQSKQNVNEWLNLPRTINYAQSDNSVETRFFGENIKGAVERLGNIEKTVVMNMRKLTNIPEAGMLWDNDYYISSVMVEVQNDIFEVSCALSKNFNRISKYIGAKSHKRVYEVSERMTQQRHSVYTDYVLFTTNSYFFDKTAEDTYLSSDGVNKLASVLYPPVGDYTIGSVILEGQNKNKNVPQNKIILPVISSAFGSSIQFTWEYKDNYSAGNRSVYVENGDVKGYFTHSVEYGDYYGMSYWQNFRLYSSDIISQAENSLNFPKWEYGMPGFADVSTKETPILKRKDNREALKETYNIEFVTDNPNFVIGSAFASRNPLVHAFNKRINPRLLILKKKINKFTKYIQYDSDVILQGTLSSKIWESNNKYFGYGGSSATRPGKAWCYVLPVTDGDEREVIDEDGNVTTFTPETKYELLFGANMDFKQNDKIGAFNAYVVHDVYEYLKTKRTN